MPVISCAASKLPGDQVKVPLYQEKEHSGRNVFPHYLPPHHKPLTHLTVLTELKAYTHKTHTHTQLHTPHAHISQLFIRLPSPWKQNCQEKFHGGLLRSVVS